jgi:hypothetical protein
MVVRKGTELSDGFVVADARLGNANAHTDTSRIINDGGKAIRADFEVLGTRIPPPVV